MSARGLVLLLGGSLVLLAAIGAIYLEIVVQSRSTHEVWMAIRDVPAGTLLTANDVRRVSVPDTGDPILYYRRDPIADHRRAAHNLLAGHMLADDDLLAGDMVLVPVAFRAAPPLGRGDLVDVYTQLGGRTVQVGRSLPVESPTTIWVPAADEPSWITLEANSAPLFAVDSGGLGVPAATGLGIQDAVAALSGSVNAGRPALGAAPPVVPAPASLTPAPAGTPGPLGTPRP
ncbi:MAG TPA: SAF domain-containing protein [Candidatus Dormibacteraeota bacterium]|nr:SAF domain-containing protein [Candidatus Dormibacteraeota bacterium]